jgi:hypothetical protein
MCRLALIVALLALGCGGRDSLIVPPLPPDGDGGSGVTPTGGVGGGPDAAPPVIGGRIDAGGGTLVCVLPSCVSTLVNACPTTGVRCRTQGSLSVGQTRQCYDNNVSVASTLGLTGAQIVVTRPDGKACYSIVGSFLGASSATFRVLDPSGTPVAEGQVEPASDGSSKIALTCTGAAGTVILPLECTPLAGAISGGGCTMGTCP